MTLVLCNVSYLAGDKYEPRTGTLLISEKGTIEAIVDSPPAQHPDYVFVDCANYIAIPSLVNSHVHVLDASLKDSWLGSNVPALFGEQGIKQVFIEQADYGALVSSARETFVWMARHGTIHCIVFVESGVRGVLACREALETVSGLKAYLLGRPLDKNLSDLEEILDVSLVVFLIKQVSDGIALSSLNGFTDSALAHIHERCAKRDRLLATHIAEVTPTTNFHRLISLYKPNFCVHGNHLNSEQLEALSAQGVCIVVIHQRLALLRALAVEVLLVKLLHCLTLFKQAYGLAWVPTM